jgi:DNA-binding NtrC family response regulator
MSSSVPDPTFVKSSAEPAATKPAHQVKILSVSPAPEDHQTLNGILKEMCTIVDAGTCREALSFLCRDRVPVIVCERDLPDGGWRDMLSYIADFVEPPTLVVTSRLADERLWAEVLNQGGYDVLAKPFSEPEVKHVLAGALGRTTGVSKRVLAAGAAGPD